MKFLAPLLLLSMTANAAPVLKAGARIQTDSALITRTVSATGAHGERLVIGVERNVNDKNNDRLVARDENGSKVADIAIYKAQSETRVDVLSAHINVKGELVAITEVTQEGFSGGSRLFADNMKTGFSTNLTQVAPYPSVQSQIRFQGRDLIALSFDLGNGAGDTRPTLIRVMDEANGAVLKDIVLQNATTSTLEVDEQGKLKLLSIGYNIFDLIDVETGAITELLPNRTKPTAVPTPTKLSIGDTLLVADHGVTTIYDKNEFVNGREKILRTYRTTEVEFRDDGAKAILLTKSAIRVVDVKSNRQIGKTLPRNPAKVAPGVGGRGQGALVGLRIEGSQAVAIISQAIQPNSYMPGTVLTYFDLASGKVLRTRRLEMYQLNPVLVANEQGHIVSIEHSFYQRDEKIQIVDVVPNKVLAEVPNESPSLIFVAASGKIVLAHARADGAVALAYVDSLSDETVVQDPMITTDSLYDAELNGAQMSLSLHDADRSSRGVQTFTVN